MTFEEIKQDEETYIMHTYGRFPIALDHGKGADAMGYGRKEIH